MAGLWKWDSFRHFKPGALPHAFKSKVQEAAWPVSCDFFMHRHPKDPGGLSWSMSWQPFVQIHGFLRDGNLKRPGPCRESKKIKARLRRDFPHSIIIAIDAAIGTAGQMGYITLRRGPLKPGLGLGKKLPPIGHIQITGVFQEMYGSHAQKQMENYCLCLFKGLSSLFTADL